MQTNAPRNFAHANSGQGTGFTYVRKLETTSIGASRNIITVLHVTYQCLPYIAHGLSSLKDNVMWSEDFPKCKTTAKFE